MLTVPVVGDEQNIARVQLDHVWPHARHAWKLRAQQTPMRRVTGPTRAVDTALAESALDDVRPKG